MSIALRIALFAALGVFSGVVSYIVWNDMLGLDGQNFVITIFTVFLLPLIVVVGGISTAVLGYAHLRDWKKGVL